VERAGAGTLRAWPKPDEIVRSFALRAGRRRIPIAVRSDLHQDLEHLVVAPETGGRDPPAALGAACSLDQGRHWDSKCHALWVPSNLDQELVAFLQQLLERVWAGRSTGQREDLLARLKACAGSTTLGQDGGDAPRLLGPLELEACTTQRWLRHRGRAVETEPRAGPVQGDSVPLQEAAANDELLTW
jgi:hypothetical protein